MTGNSGVCDIGLTCMEGNESMAGDLWRFSRGDGLFLRCAESLYACGTTIMASKNRCLQSLTAGICTILREPVGWPKRVALSYLARTSMKQYAR